MLLLRRLFRERVRKVVHYIDGTPFTPIEWRDFRFQQRRVIPSQGKVERYGKRCAPGAYAGEYPTMRWPEGIRIHVRFTRELAANARRLRARHRYAPLLRFHPARFTLRELNAVSNRIAEDSDQLAADGIEMSTVSVGERRNRVLVGTCHGDRTAQERELRRRYGPTVRVTDECLVPL
jgi:hypothetical protein